MFIKRVFLKGEYELVISPIRKGDPDYPISESLEAVLASGGGAMASFDFTSPYGDEVSLPIPEGSVQAYVEKHKALFSDPDIHIRIGGTYRKVPEEKLFIPELPEGAKFESMNEAIERSERVNSHFKGRKLDDQKGFCG